MSEWPLLYDQMMCVQLFFFWRVSGHGENALIHPAMQLLHRHVVCVERK